MGVFCKPVRFSLVIIFLSSEGFHFAPDHLPSIASELTPHRLNAGPPASRRPAKRCLLGVSIHETDQMKSAKCLQRNKLFARLPLAQVCVLSSRLGFGRKVSRWDIVRRRGKQCSLMCTRAMVDDSLSAGDVILMTSLHLRPPRDWLKRCSCKCMWTRFGY